MDESTKNKIFKLAAELFSTDIVKIKKYHKEIPEANAIYFWEPVRGGGALIISANEEILYASSSINYDKHLKEFLNGRRTPKESFNNYHSQMP